MLEPLRSRRTTLVNRCPCGGRIYRSPRLLRYTSCHVVRCSSCGLLRTCPEPTPEALDVIYDATRSSKYTITRDAGKEAEWRGFARGTMDFIETYRPSRGRLLDVGCDTGEYLAEAQERGWEVTGVEINEPVAQDVAGRLGVRVIASTLEDAHLPADEYDAVMFNQVLEHVPDPIAFLTEVHRVLKPGGVIFVGVPCFASVIPLFLKRDRWYALVPSEHIWQFGPRTLPRLLSDAGFEIAELKRGCSGFWGELRPRPRDAARWILYRTVAVLNQGDFMDVIARKPLRGRVA
jgi:SAM-dependent methyltransferase